MCSSVRATLFLVVFNLHKKYKFAVYLHGAIISICRCGFHIVNPYSQALRWHERGSPRKMPSVTFNRWVSSHHNILRIGFMPSALLIFSVIFAFCLNGCGEKLKTPVKNALKARKVHARKIKLEKQGQKSTTNPVSGSKSNPEQSKTLDNWWSKISIKTFHE